jgi:thiol-disulfide isomerase/thioredoxin
MPPKKKANTNKTKKMGKVFTNGNNSVDVTKTGDIPQLSDILNKNKFIIVLVWADYCGHCHTFKDQVWNKLLANKQRKAGLASIHYDQLETTPSSIPKKVPGYPTVLFIGKNGVPMKFKDERTGSSTFEYPKSRDVTKMTEISEAEDPESLLNLETGDTPPLTQEAENQSALSNPEDVLNSIPYKRNLGNKVSAPNYKDDMLNSQVKDEKREVDSGRMKGGAFYRALLDMLKYSDTRSAKPKRRNQTRKGSRS